MIGWDALGIVAGESAAAETAVRQGAAVLPLVGRTQLRLTGPDRAKFLHNLCTNDIKNLAVGRTCEAYLCNAKGHVLWLVDVTNEGESLRIAAPPGEAEPLFAHLDKYHVREAIELVDVSDETAELLLVGPHAPALMPGICDNAGPGNSRRNASEMPFLGLTDGPEILLRITPERLPEVWQALLAAGFVVIGPDVREYFRIEAGRPMPRREILDGTLPQELSRDRSAIHFNKGCYLGQETVARLDALGHVNKLLVILSAPPGPLPETLPVEWQVEGKVIGRLTSVARSALDGTRKALGYVRRGKHLPGTHAIFAGETWTVGEPWTPQ